jgi:hypothetical protein
LWREIAASKFAANEIKLNPFILAGLILIIKSRASMFLTSYFPRRAVPIGAGLILLATD